MPVRKAVLGVVLVVGAIVLGGCVVFQTPPVAGQQGQLGSVRITFTACASQTGGSPPTGSCTNQGNSGRNASTDPSQLFVGFRVPKGASAPASFSSSSTGPSNTGPQLRFTTSLFYTSELQRLKPAPANEQWVGYVSQYVSYNSTSGEQNFTASVNFGLPKGANGAPYVGPFTYQAVVGGRQYPTTSTPDPNEPIDCKTSLTSGYGGPGTPDDWICVDDQSPSTLGTDTLISTRDAGVEPGAAQTVKPGSTAAVPFKFAYAGSSTPGTFTFSGSTTLGGTSATPSPGTFSPTSTSSTPVNVSVPVPKNAKPGPYTVTLTARLADGETRTGTVTLNVLAQCKVPKLKGRKLARARQLLKKANCRLGKIKRRHFKAPKGRITAQRPKPGKRLDAGSKVRVTVSLGP